MPRRPNHARHDSPPPSQVKVCLPKRAPVQHLGTRLPLPSPASHTRSSNVSSKAKASRLYQYRAPFSLPKTTSLLQLAKPRADFGPPNVPIPIKDSIYQSRNRRSTSHPLRGSSRFPSPNTVSEWKKTSRRPGNTRMNPMASSFQPPKPTYAQKVKSSLPARSASEGTAVSTAPIQVGTEVEALVLGNSRQQTKQSTSNHQTRQLQGEHESVQVVEGELPQETSVSRHHSSTPSTQITMGGERPLAGSDLFPNPLGHRSDFWETSRDSYDWCNQHQFQQPPMPFPNPITGSYSSYPQVPGGQYLPPGYYHPHFQSSPIPWDAAAGAAVWEDFHRSQSAQGVYGPFPPPPMALQDMYQPPHMPYPTPSFTPFHNWGLGHPMAGPDTQSQTPTPQTHRQQQPPESARRSPSKGKRHQLNREAHRATQSRDRQMSRAEAWRAREKGPAVPWPIYQQVNSSREVSTGSRRALSHANIPQESNLHPQATLTPEVQLQYQSTEVDSTEQRGRTRYRLVSTKAKVLSDERNRHKQNEEGHRPGSSPSESLLMVGNDRGDARSLSHHTQHNPGVNSRALLLHEQPPAPSRTPVKAGGPPPNAPTEPASLRRFANLQQFRTSLIQKPAEQGSWSQSKRWVSQETKERTAFQKLMHSLHYMGADNSPFLPKTPAELTRFKIAQADRKSKRMAEKLRCLEERRFRRVRAQEEGISSDDDKPELFWGKKMSGNLSPVFAQEGCFNEDVPPEESEFMVDWPSRGELKEEGDRRAARYGRYFPLPRLNMVASRILEEENESPYNNDGTISWEKKAVKLSSRFIRPVTSELELPSGESLLLDMHELHEPLRHLLEEIDRIGRDEEDAKGKKTDRG